MKYCVRLFCFVVGFLRDNFHQVKCLLLTLFFFCSNCVDKDCLHLCNLWAEWQQVWLQVSCIKGIFLSQCWQMHIFTRTDEIGHVQGSMAVDCTSLMIPLVWFIWLVWEETECPGFYFIFFLAGSRYFPFCFFSPSPSILQRMPLLLLYSYSLEALPFNSVTTHPTRYYIPSLQPVHWFTRNIVRYFHTYSGRFLSCRGRGVDFRSAVGSLFSHSLFLSSVSSIHPQPHLSAKFERWLCENRQFFLYLQWIWSL